MNKLCLILIVSSFIACISGAVVKLGRYEIDKSKITVSGISSGAAMAAQLQVAYSKLFSGAGLVAGPPYYCARGSSTTAVTSCMNTFLGSIQLSPLYKQVDTYASSGLIDDPANLKNARMYYYSGTLDVIVMPGIVRKTQEFFENYVSKSNSKTVYTVASVHGFITNNYGRSCSILASNYINNCNYNQAHDILSHVLGAENLIEPSKTYQPSGILIEFDQKEFFEGTRHSLDDSGYLYVPEQCRKDRICKLHVALHGCAMGKASIGTDFVLNAGFNHVADLNDLIILYPQAKSNFAAGNQNGCWDWWGYSDANYANNKGVQMKAIKAMIDRIAP